MNAPLAAAATQLIVAGMEGLGLKWSADRATVTVVLNKILPEASNAQTQQSRNSRFKSDLIPMLAKDGWHRVEPPRNRLVFAKKKRRRLSAV